ncbi:MAG: DUF1553 domain-containing protein [Planctomycetaceae bacterium]|nr:DUF1553 domain-containing protein [Planctomycetaceae bacterium]
MWTFQRQFAFLLATLALTVSAKTQGDEIFREQVAPLLERRCLSCHNDGDRKGDFSLQTQRQLEDSGFVVPGNADESQLLNVVTSHGPGDERPSMPKDGRPLTAAEVDLLRQWIAAGAVWPTDFRLSEPTVENFDWWSLRPLELPTPPVFEDATALSWLKTPIDAFVLQTLRDHALQPSPESDRLRLIRRVTFDLTGLPPTPEEIKAYIDDAEPNAYERVIDRLLDSPHYGERWARHWLDVVRYADTCGYDKDKLRPNAWPYRDYVIRAFNTDKPYARFVQEQIAGDVLFPGEPDGILGLGFIAAGPWDFIGHVEVSESKIDGLVARNLDRDDMVTGALNTFCSTTIQCARCHNHKFDPFTQQHYYSLQSVFAAVDRAERIYDTDPAVETKRRELLARKSQAERQLEELEKSIRAEGGQRLVMLEETLTRLRPLAEPTTKRPEFGYHSEISTAADNEKWVEIDLGRDVELTSIVLHACHDEFAGIGAGFGFPRRYRIEVTPASQRAAGRPAVVVRDATAASVANPGLTPVKIPCVETARYIRVVATQLAARQNDFILALGEVEAFDSDGKNVAAHAPVTALDSIESPVRWSRGNLTDTIWPVAADHDAAFALLEARQTRDALLKNLNSADRRQMRETLIQQLAVLEKQLSELPRGRVVYAAATHFARQGNFHPTEGRPRPVKVLHRGNETQPGDDVQPGTIPLRADDAWQFQLPVDHAESDRRAALARWMTRPDHPLTWRSIVNRVWQYHFGRGIVDSPNDFGRMGQLPTHAALLDWLAIQFRDNGQSFRKLHRLIVTSAVYRQASAGNPAAELIDAENRFLWRMNRRRLEAEEIRDAILAVSGKLNLESGGPGFYLFELEKPEHSPHYEYNKFDPEDVQSHRRSIYRFIVRSQPDPFMTTLDCADSSQSTPRRHETQTALQALSLLNNRFTLSMARHLAQRLDSTEDSTDEKIELAFRLLTGRAPDQEERRQMIVYADKHGLAALCRLLFNLNEFVFVE